MNDYARAFPALLLFLAASLLAACGGGPGAPDAADVGTFPDAPVILISIDTLRSDRMPAYGYEEVETPHFNAFRDDSILFERAYSHYPLTLPSHSSVFTGLLPTEHGVRDNQGYRLDTSAHPYLPALLKERGYATGAAVSSFVLRGAVGLSDHFDFYDDSIETGSTLGLGSVQRSGTETLQLASEWLEETVGAGGGEVPLLFFFHIYEPHSPYTPPEPFASRYADAYDGEVAASDAIIGDFLAELQRLGLYDRSIIALFSDHGEGLGDHAEPEHGVLLYREVLQVPLMLKLPGQRLAGARSDTSVQLIDIAPTVLDLLGLPRPPELTGPSLLDLMADDAPERPIYAETYYPRLHMGWSELTSLVEDNYHYIHGPDPELYDMATDFTEQNNIRSQEPRQFASMRQELSTFWRELSKPTEEDPETRERLAALGYLSTGTAATEGPLPDPKTQFAALEKLARAQRLSQQNKQEESEQLARELLDENPNMQDAWVTLALALAEQGEVPDAIEAYRRAMELVGPAAHITTKLVSLYQQMGNLTAAAEHAELLLTVNPAWAHLKLSEIALLREDMATAEHHARLCVEERGTLITPLIQLTKVLAWENKLQEAQQILDQAEKEMARRTSQDDVVGLHYVRGDLLARQGELAAAKQQFEQEIELHPQHLDAYGRLAFLLAFEGDGRAAADMLRTMVERHPNPAAYSLAVRTLRLLGDDRSASGLLQYALGRFPRSEQLRALRNA